MGFQHEMWWIFMKNKEKVVIVGAGVAGLTSAAYLLKDGYEVHLLEASNRTGGLVHSFERDGFVFDTGPRAFVNSGMVKPIMKDLDIDFDVVQNQIAIAIEDKHFTIDSLESINQYKDILIELYPNNEEDINEIMPIIHNLSKHTAVLYEFDNPYFVDYVSDKKVFFGQLLPWTFRLLFSLRKFNKYGMPMEDFLRTKTGNESLINILTQYFFKETPTYFALGYFHVYMDYFYPKKGTQTLPKLLEEKIRDLGGTIQFNARINKIQPHQKKVIDTNGNEYPYDHLIWSANLRTLYQSTDVEGLSNKIVKSFNNQYQRVMDAEVAESIFMMFVGVNRQPEYFQKVSGEHMFFTPSKSGLGALNQEKKIEILENFKNLSKQEIFAWAKDYFTRNTFEVSIPVLRDPSLAPKGQTGIMISCLFDYDITKKLQESSWLEEFKEEMEQHIITLFSNSIFKDIKEEVLFHFSTTPVEIEKITGNAKGGIVGWSFQTKAPVYNKLKDLSKSVLTPLPDIYQASQWAYAPAGVPIAMLTGWQAVQRIHKKKQKKN